MTSFNRRDLFGRGLFGLGALGLSSSGIRALNPAGRNARALVRNANPRRQLLVIFLRGANDGANTVIPRNDTSYATCRPNLAITNGLPLSADAEAHPELADAVSGPQNPWSAGRIAFLHQVGNGADAVVDRSHFTQQQVWETGKVPATPGGALLAEGVFPRFIREFYPNGSPTSLPALGVSSYYRMFHAVPSTALGQSSPILGEYGNISNPDLASALSPSTDDLVQQKLDQLLASGGTGSLLDTVVDYSEAALDSADILKNGLTTDASSFITMNSGDSGNVSSFLGGLVKSLEVLHDLPGCRVVGLNFGGFDTHTDQKGRHEELMNALGRALKGITAFSADPARRPGFDPNFMTLVISEFGRTAKDNGPSAGTSPDTAGTDHGRGGLAIAMGRNVNGGTYNMGPSAWPDGHLAAQGALPTNDPSSNALPVLHDFRAMYAEIFDRWFGLGSAEIGEILPDGAPSPSDYINFL